MNFNLDNILEEFKQKRGIFIHDYSTNKKISYQDFYKKILDLKNEVNKLNSKSTYILDTANDIQSLIYITTFLLCKKKILLKDKKNFDKKTFSNFNLSFCHFKNFKKIIPLSKKGVKRKIIESDFDLLIMSSGSTGKSKLVKLKFKKSILNSHSMNLQLNLDSNNIHLLIMPIYHVNSLFFSFFSSILNKQ